MNYQNLLAGLKTDALLCPVIRFYLNGREIRMTIPPGMTVLELLHEKLAHYGTKLSCREGDCGSCTVIIAGRRGEKTLYQTVNSCLYPAARLHGKHLITVEGITGKGRLHPIQTAILDEHGTQCGYCTPGFVMSILGLLLNSRQPEDEEILAALEGNLCRCTGYDSIFKAAQLVRDTLPSDAALLPAGLLKAEKLLSGIPTQPDYIITDNPEGWESRAYFVPQQLSELWQIIKALPQDVDYKFINGGTDLQVQANIQQQHPDVWLDLTNISEFRGISQTDEKITIGSLTTLSEVRDSELIHRHYPLIVNTITKMASRQIRNLATLAGNIANASPVADAAIVLLALDAQLQLISPQGQRKVSLSEFYLDYKKTALLPEELIAAIELSLPPQGTVFAHMLKSAKRKAVDISSVNSSICLQLKGKQITQARLCYGGVAVYPALAQKTSEYLTGKEITVELFKKASELAVSEFIPISDIRGSALFRSLLIENHLMRYGLMILTGESGGRIDD